MFFLLYYHKWPCSNTGTPGPKVMTLTIFEEAFLLIINWYLVCHHDDQATYAEVEKKDVGKKLAVLNPSKAP